MRFIAITTVVAAGMATLLTLRRVRSTRLFLLRDLSLGVCAVALYEVVWLLKLTPIFATPGRNADFAGNHPFGILALELLPPAAVSAAVWWVLRRFSIPAVGAIMIIATIAAFASAAFTAPYFLRGFAEAAGLLPPLSPYHLSGVYTFSATRNLAYAFACPAAGLPVALRLRARGRTPFS